MTAINLYETALYLLFVIAVIIAAVLHFINAPYGRHLRRGFGPLISSTLGWVIMESAAVFTISIFFFTSDRSGHPVSIVFFIMWQAHYLYRAFLFPFRRRKGHKNSMPVTVLLMALVFNVWNGCLNGGSLFVLGPDRSVDWFLDPRFIGGFALFVIGMVINHNSDGILLRLRASGETGYKIPHGGLFRYVSMPNYLGEILEWIGWALATWSLAGLSFAVFTAANLVPRALANHQWYKEKFPNYPKKRKAIIPFLF